MKAHLLMLLFTMSCIFVPVSASADEIDEVVIRSVNPTTRSFSEIPEAHLCGDILNVSFISAGVYVLQIEDGLGVPVYTSSLPADGMEYSYDLSGIGEGMFRLVLEGPGGEYEGFFTILKN